MLIQLKLKLNKIFFKCFQDPKICSATFLHNRIFHLFPWIVTGSLRLRQALEEDLQSLQQQMRCNRNRDNKLVALLLKESLQRTITFCRLDMQVLNRLFQHSL
jgi:hypothetical protein